MRDIAAAFEAEGAEAAPEEPVELPDPPLSDPPLDGEDVSEPPIEGGTREENS
jgi:hypothetical protein